MRRLAYVVVLLVCLAPRLPGAQALEGLWQGTVPLAQPATLVVDFDAGAATFNGSQPVPIAKVPAPAGGDAVEFDVAASGRAYRFSGRRDGARIAGTFVGQPVSLVRLPDSAPRLALRRHYPLPSTSAGDAGAIAQARATVADLVRAQQISPASRSPWRGTVRSSGPRASASPTSNSACLAIRVTDGT